MECWSTKRSQSRVGCFIYTCSGAGSKIPLALILDRQSASAEPLSDRRLRICVWRRVFFPLRYHRHPQHSTVCPKTITNREPWLAGIKPSRVYPKTTPMGPLARQTSNGGNYARSTFLPDVCLRAAGCSTNYARSGLEPTSGHH